MTQRQQMRVRRPTMRDVASLAGVGIKTVSRVVNSEPNVSEPTRQRVQEAIAQLDFQPNLNAGNLKRSDGRTQTIGLLVGNVANPFYAAIHRAVEDEAWERGVTVLAASLAETPAKEQAAVGVFLNRRVDGLILAPTAPRQDYLLSEIHRGTPVVFLDRDPIGIVGDSFTAENRGGARLAVQHLIDQGHRRIAFLGAALRIQTARERLNGFTDAVTAAGISADELPILTGMPDAESTERQVTELLDSDNPPTAIFAAQNLSTIGAVRALHARGLEHRIALVGFDDFSLADMLDPGVSVVAQDPAQLGALAVRQLFSRLDGDDSPVTTVRLPVTLVARGSGEIPPPKGAL